MLIQFNQLILLLFCTETNRYPFFNVAGFASKSDSLGKGRINLLNVVIFVVSIIPLFIFRLS